MCRFLALFLTVSLILPPTAFALKPTETKEGAGLEELDKTLRAFTSGNPDDLKTAGLHLAQAVGLTSSVNSIPPVIQSTQLQAAGMEEAESLLLALTHFQTERDFTRKNSTVRIIPYGRTNRAFLIERNDGIKLVGFRLANIWNFPVLDRNHYRFEKKQATTLQAKILPEGWKTFRFLERKDRGSKLYQDEQGNYWRFMPFVEGRVIRSVDEIPAGKRLDAVERFSRVLVRFRRMLETIPEEQFEDSAPNLQSTTYHLGHYDRVLAGTDVEVSLSSNLTRKVRMEPSRLTGQDSNGDFAARNKNFQAKVARYRSVMESALKGQRSVVTHGDPQLDNVFWEVDANGSWLPLGMGDLDYVQLGHETLDIADAVRAFSFIGGLDANPDNLALLRNVVETMIESWLDEVGQVYGEAERQRLEPFVYPSTAAIYFRLAVRFYDSFLTGDSHFEGPIRYGKLVSDPGKYLRRAEIQMAQAETFIRAFKDKSGMENLAALITQAGLEETAPDVLPGQSVREIIEQQGGMVPGAAQRKAGQLYADRPDVQETLRVNEGRLRLTAEVAGKLTGRADALGGLLISGSAADLLSEDFMVIADSDLSNPAAQQVLAWIPGGPDSPHVAKTLGILKAGPRQVALFEEEPGLTSERVQALVAESLAGAPSPRSVVGTQDQVKALPVAAFKVLAKMKGLPDVVFLGVAVTFKDQYDQQYSLIVWTQA